MQPPPPQTLLLHARLLLHTFLHHPQATQLPDGRVLVAAAASSCLLLPAALAAVALEPQCGLALEACLAGPGAAALGGGGGAFGGGAGPSPMDSVGAAAGAAAAGAAPLALLAPGESVTWAFILTRSAGGALELQFLQALGCVDPFSFVLLSTHTREKLPTCHAVVVPCARACPQRGVSMTARLRAAPPRAHPHARPTSPHPPPHFATLSCTIFAT